MTTADPTIDTAALLKAEHARTLAHRRVDLAAKAVDALAALRDTFGPDDGARLDTDTRSAWSRACVVLVGARRSVSEL